MAKKTSKRKPASKKRVGTKKNNPRKGFGSFLTILLVIVALLSFSVYYIDGFEVPIVKEITGRKETVDSKKSEPSKKSTKKIEKQNSIKPVTKTKSKSKNTEITNTSSETTVNPKVSDKVPDYGEVNDFYFTSAFDFPWPEYSLNDQIVEHEGYTLCYNEQHEQPTWVAYKLSKSNLVSKKVKRTDDFREDDAVATRSATLNDYRRSGYDRGHLAPAADFAYSEEAMSGTFFLSNISPQIHEFNSGIWNVLEQKIRDWAMRDEELFVVTGPVFRGQSKGKIGRNRVGVPTHFYKVVLDINPPEVKAIGFIFEHRKYEEPKKFIKYAMTVDEVERFTGLDFFPMIPDALETSIEKDLFVHRWR